MDAVEFLKQLERFCDHQPDCDDCYLLDNIICNNVRSRVFDNPRKLVAHIEKWADKHPQKRIKRLQNFWSKFHI